MKPKSLLWLLLVSTSLAISACATLSSGVREEELITWKSPPASLSESRLAMLVVVDRSASTLTSLTPINKSDVFLEVPGELGDDDLFGVIAFADQPRTLLPLKPIPWYGTHNVARTALPSPSGATSALSALDEARKEFLSTARYAKKHIVLVSDGRIAYDRQLYRELFETLSREHITLSTVAIGEGSSVQELKRMAGDGKGVFYQLRTPGGWRRALGNEIRRLKRSMS